MTMTRCSICLTFWFFRACESYGPLPGPDPVGVPAEFLCGWRRLALNYTNQIRPDSVLDAYEALDIQKYCGDGPPIPGPAIFPANSPPLGQIVVFVDAVHGSDDASGSEQAPVRTAHAALSLTRKTIRNSATIVFRAGKHFIHSPLAIEVQDANLTLQNYPGEEAWLSGAQQLLDLQWEQHNVDPEKGMNVWKADLSAYDFVDISELRVDSKRMMPARYPNANAELDIWPKGYVSGGEWMSPKIKPKTSTLVHVNNPDREWDEAFPHYTGGINGSCSVFDPPFSYFCQNKFPHAPDGGCGMCSSYYIPGGLNFTRCKTKLRNVTYQNYENAVLFAWRKAHWANWAFEIEKYDSESSIFTFGRGGFQGARGGPGSDWFVSHVLEELDAPTEFYYSPSQKSLYYFPENGTRPTESTFESVVQHTLIRVVGSQDAPVQGFHVLGLGFRDTAGTMMQPHGVPSGGDWALERMGVLYLEGVYGPIVDRVKMWKIGGNGVMLSKYVQGAHVVDSEFVWVGSTAVAAWGWTDEISNAGIHGIDGTGGEFPRHTKIERNVFREIGILEKQSSAFFQAKAAETILKHNVVFNLARAGFNFNDGFGGGDVVTENVLFNTCRESADHGPINAWDRQPYITTVRNGTPSSQMAWRDISHNVLISNYGAKKEVDLDDGCLFYRIHHNFVAYGLGQKFKCGAIESSFNLKAFVDLGGKFDAGCTHSQPDHFFPNLWHNDTMVHLGRGNFSYRSCWKSDQIGHDWDKSQVQNNTFYLQPNTHAVVSCNRTTLTLTEFQEDGNDPGSKEINHIPTTEGILEMARQTIGDVWVKNANCSWFRDSGLASADVERVHVTSKEDCCNSCIAANRCLAAVFTDGICHFKHVYHVDDLVSDRLGSVACVPGVNAELII